MKTKQMAFAVFYLSLYLVTTYWYWTSPILTPNNEPSSGLAPLEFALLVWYLGSGCGTFKRMNPKNPNIAAGVMTVATIISPVWWATAGIAWLIIFGFKKITVFLKTNNWAT